jgi:predicted ArsR family transcriptional regulator
MLTARQQVLEYIRIQRAVTSSDVARALRMTGANARHHLAILQAQGLIEVIGRRPTDGRGRPAKLFALTDRILGDNLPNLASALLNQFIYKALPTERSHIWQELAILIIDSVNDNVHGETKKSQGSLTQRLYNAMILLNRMNYDARWVAHPEAPFVILGHCPYAAILDQHPELCQFDRFLLIEMLGTSVTQKKRLDLDSRGIKHCAFTLS